MAGVLLKKSAWITSAQFYYNDNKIIPIFIFIEINFIPYKCLPVRKTASIRAVVSSVTLGTTQRARRTMAIDKSVIIVFLI